MQQTPAVYEFGSVSGSAVSLAVFFLICVFAGVAVYLLLTRPWFRRAEMRGVGIVRRPVAIGIAVVVALTACVVYLTSVDGFHTLIADGERVELRYAFPTRTHIVRLPEITHINRIAGNNASWRLRILTRGGTSYRSTPVPAEDVDRAIEGLRDLGYGAR